MFKKLLLKWLFKDTTIERSLGSNHIGPFTITTAPPNWKEYGHDAQKAIYCDGYIVFCYGKTEDFPNA